MKRPHSYRPWHFLRLLVDGGFLFQTLPHHQEHVRLRHLVAKQGQLIPPLLHQQPFGRGPRIRQQMPALFHDEAGDVSYWLVIVGSSQVSCCRHVGMPVSITLSGAQAQQIATRARTEDAPPAKKPRSDRATTTDLIQGTTMADLTREDLTSILHGIDEHQYNLINAGRLTREDRQEHCTCSHGVSC